MSAMNLWLITTVILITGCANTLRVTYRSDPNGATVYEERKRVGITPVTTTYRLTEEDKKRGYLRIGGVRALWPSGASAELSSMTADLRNGRRQEMTFIRPEDFPGREADIRFELELEKLKAMNRQAAAQEEQARSAQELNESIDRQYRNPPLRQPTNCTSRALGNTVYTDCY